MGFKFWNLQQLIPTCFYLLGSSSSHVSTVQPLDDPRKLGPNDVDRPIPRRHKKLPIRVVRPNGVVRIYTKPVRASMLMLEFPTHLLCRSDSFYIGQKIPALNPKKKLKRGHNYFLLPRPYFQSTLTFAAAASFATAAAAQPRGLCSAKLANSCRAFSIEKTKNGVLKIRVSDEFIAQLTNEQRKTTMSYKAGEKGNVCNTPQLMKDYTQLVGSSRQWRPKLETIKEKEKEKRNFKSFRRKKKVLQPSKGLIVNQVHQSQKSPRLKNKVVRIRK